jgi:hypothetical protein
MVAIDLLAGALSTANSTSGTERLRPLKGDPNERLVSIRMSTWSDWP